MRISKEVKSILQSCLSIINIELCCCNNTVKKIRLQKQLDNLSSFVDKPSAFDVPPKEAIKAMKEKKQWLKRYFKMAKEYKYSESSITSANKTLNIVNKFLTNYKKVT